MDQPSAQEQRLIWSLWLAAGVAAAGGLMPLVFGGTSSRFADIIFPFWLGAAALAACALLHGQNRSLVAAIYFVAGLAIIYGMLSMFSLPIRLAALGTCPAAPAPCPTGLARPLTDGENNGMGAAAGLGIAAVLIGFFGLVTLFRRPLLSPPAPPERTIPAFEPRHTPTVEARVEAGPQAAPKAEAEAEAEPEPELPAPEELPELPPHESSTPTT